MTTVAVIGATSGMAHAAMRLWAGRGASLLLVGRDADRLGRIADDLQARGSSSISVLEQSLDSAADVAAAVSWVFASGPVDVVLIAFGSMPLQSEADSSVDVAYELLEVNGTLNLLCAHAFALQLSAQGSGALAIIGSVAGDRGRQSNYLYGAAKAMVATGVAGLQHRFTGSSVRVTLVKPGPTATPMTDHLRGGRVQLARVETVASDIVRAVDRGSLVVYTPRKWQLIMTIIRLLPRKVFERTKL